MAVRGPTTPVLAVLATLLLGTAVCFAAASAAESRVSISNRALLAGSASSTSDTISVPRVTLGSILSSIIKWPSNMLSGLGSAQSSAQTVLDLGTGGDLGTQSASTTSPPASSGSPSSSDMSTSNAPTADATASGVPQILQPLTDAGIAAINRLLAGNESHNGPYHFDTGLPPLQDLIILNKTAQQSEVALSTDRLQRLAQRSEPLGWVIRSFAVSGDALLKLRLSTDLQLIIRDVISNSLKQSTAVPEEQILAFAASNVSISLGFKGVDWHSTDAVAGAGPNPGLTAVRNALAELAEGFDPNHISVSFSAADNAATATAGSRRMLQAGPAGSPQQQQQTVVVYATFYNLDPANSTSLLEALAQQCSTMTLEDTSTASGPVFTPLTAFEPGTQLTPGCQSEFQAEFTKQGVPVSTQAFLVTPVDKPQATVDLSVAVGLTNAQTLTDLDERTGSWLNSSALNDILSEFNLTAVPTDFTEFIFDPVTGTFPQLPGLNLSSLMDKLEAPRGDTGSAVANHSQSAKTGVIGKAIIAGISVAAVASMLALAGVIWLLLRNRRSAGNGAQSHLPTSTGGDASDSNSRRRRRRPRVYHNKYISGSDAATHSSDTASSSAEAAAAVAAEQPKHHLERGDSVSSAVKFEADDEPASDSDASPSAAAAATAAGQQHYAGSPCSSSSASSSSSAAAAASGRAPLHQRVIELQLYRATGQQHGSGAASAYSLMHDAGSSISSEAPSSRGSKELPCSSTSFPSRFVAAAAAAEAYDASINLVSNKGEHDSVSAKQQMKQGLVVSLGSGVQTQVLNPIATALVPSTSQANVIGDLSSVTTDLGQASSSLGCLSDASRAYSMQRSVSATLLADAAAAVLAQKALARSQPATAPSVGGSSRSHADQVRGFGARQLERSDLAGADGIPSSPLPLKQAVVSATCTPPATPVADAAALFAAMDAQLTAAAAGRSSGGDRHSTEGVQPLGSSCWHHEKHVSGFLVPEAASWPVGVPPGQRQEPEQPQQQHVHTAGAWVSPFGMAAQQQQQRCSSGGASVPGSGLQQQQSRHSHGGQTMLSPFASEKEQQRISNSGCKELAASFAAPVIMPTAAAEDQ